MLRLSRSQGVRKLVLTPHYYPNREAPEEFLARRYGSASRLKEVLRGEGKIPDLYLGAEVAFFHGISRVESMRRLCIEGTNVLLVEMPFCRWSRNMLDELVGLQERRGIQPVLAHVERYLRHQELGMVRELCANGVMLQANASFFLEKGFSWFAMRMLRHEQIHLLGSDCHNMRTRQPNLGPAVERIREKLGDGILDYLKHMQEQVLEDEP